jgi:hypothetical protein
VSGDRCQRDADRQTNGYQQTGIAKHQAQDLITSRAERETDADLVRAACDGLDGKII